jgi:kynurenine formamidase
MPTPNVPGNVGFKSSEPSRLNQADVGDLMRTLSNWCRWGKEDQLGALNLITPAKRKQAAGEVKEGVSISLSYNTITRPLFGSQPFLHRMIKTGQLPGSTGADDIYSVQFHGFTVTHLDALCHFFFGQTMYNGFSSHLVTDRGAQRLSVINMKNGIFTRGVLMDLPRLFEIDYLKAGQPIYPGDLDAWEQRAGFKVESGDAVFIRTGRWRRYDVEGEWSPLDGSAGLDVTCMPWLKQRDMAVLGSDLASDVLPSGVIGTDRQYLPVHMLALVAMGVPILDNCDLEPLSREAAARNRWTFLLSVAPLAVEGGSGSPVNPIATF